MAVLCHLDRHVDRHRARQQARIMDERDRDVPLGAMAGNGALNWGPRARPHAAHHLAERLPGAAWRVPDDLVRELCPAGLVGVDRLKAPQPERLARVAAATEIERHLALDGTATVH